MPFGKYSDHQIIDIFIDDVEYLVWAIMNIDRYYFSYEVREMVFLASSQKCKDKHGFTDPNISGKSKQESKQTPQKDSSEYLPEYRKLCKFAHPDLGGDTEIMQIINKWYNLIKTL